MRPKSVHPLRRPSTADATSVLIANTHKPTGAHRPNSLVEVADVIALLRDRLGGLQPVSEIARVSTEMLRRFLSARMLCTDVQELVATRKIDSLNVVHYMRTLSASDQRRVAQAALAGTLSGSDVRGLLPIHRRRPKLSTRKLMVQASKSKNRRVYTLIVPTPSNASAMARIHRKFAAIVGHSEVLDCRPTRQGLKVTLSARGAKALAESASRRNVSLRDFVLGLATTPSSQASSTDK